MPETRTISKKEPIGLDDALTLTGFGFFNWLALLISGGCLMCVIIETTSMMFIIPASQCDLELSLSEKSILSSISFIGVVSSSHLWGFIADTKGRKNMLLSNLIISQILSLLSSIVPWTGLFIIMKFLSGFFIGGASSLIFAYIGEFHNDKSRPKMVSWVSTFVAFGNLYLPAIAWLILDETWNLNVLGFIYRPWRLLLVLYALPGLLVAVGIYILPESPKYLLAHGRKDDTIEVLKIMYALNSGNSKNEYPVGNVVLDGSDIDVVNKESNLLVFIWKQTAPIFHKNYCVKTVLLCVLQFGMFAMYGGLIMWYPQIINRMSKLRTTTNETILLCSAFSEGENGSELPSHLDDEIKFAKCDDSVKHDVFLVLLAIALLVLLVYTFIGLVITRIGRRRLLIILLVSGGVAAMCAQLVHGYVPVLMLLVAYIMTSACLGVINTVAVDLYPTRVRGMALAVSLMCGRLGAFAGSNLAGLLVERWCEWLFYGVAGVQIALAGTVLMLPSSKLPEARVVT